ncbi:hypothetical protein SARC_01137 [Sphaeroforma arctica JP610]|uniref:JmjC domain-containing protein n=1 Tax=Sphaeroforma arctica JP610 TaxID=667725 RepID=A0A0L0GCI1_9EUKA|nr:hypothetical protein SARC_01137 [Sphaeroforma arctica JP610]KNC86717.1 hypothetical protein SARC_01137 [Sphaeroforma arctica JP610]|eukprot:XP_014160619.1 hypothetical protein SARC_01137 [Sphaeroforma arctica JP610]
MSHTGEDDGPTEDMDIEFSQLVHPLSTKAFLADVWGRKIHCGKLHEDVLDNITEYFHGGEFASIVSESRKDDNTKYSSEEVSEMQSCLDSNQTVNLPFCFTPGARGIRNAFMRECVGYASGDVEVGVYFSVVGGIPAPWHLDNNHNITIQITGKKDWLLIPGEKHENLTSSREIHDVPTNMKELLVTIPGTSPTHYECFTLEPGSILYLPPGHWHSVVPVASESFSVDLRVANVSQAKWIAEAIFSLLSNNPSEGVTELQKHFASVGPSELSAGGSTSHTQYILELLKTSCLDRVVNECRLPRGYQSESQHSDGLSLGASLGFLLDSEPYIDHFESDSQGSAVKPTEFRMNPLVSMICKRHGGVSFSFSLLSVSSLTKADYLNFTIHVDEGLSDTNFAFMRKLSQAPEWMQTLDLKYEDDSKTRKRKRHESTTDEDYQEQIMNDLLNILLWGNVIFGR